MKNGTCIKLQHFAHAERGSEAAGLRAVAGAAVRGCEGRGEVVACEEHVPPRRPQLVG